MIYTRTGDNGTTSLIGGTRVPKYDLRVETYGTIDELVSYLGLVRDCLSSETLNSELVKIQSTLFNIESIIACEKEELKAKMPKVKEEDIAYLERKINVMTESLPQMKGFVLVGGSRTSSHVHVARTICRRCERLCVRLSEEIGVEETILKYLNRLSDYLFVLARYILKRKGREETYWKP